MNWKDKYDKDELLKEGLITQQEHRTWDTMTPKFEKLEHQYIEAALNEQYGSVGITDTTGQRWLLKHSGATTTIQRGKTIHKITRKTVIEYLQRED